MNSRANIFSYDGRSESIGGRYGFISLVPFLAWFPMLTRQVVRNDIGAGVVAGILIVPQAVALATLAGLPPEYGLYTSIVPVIVASLFGSSFKALSGPNTALAIMIATAVSPYASVGTPDYIMYAITLSCMVGMFQLLIAVLGLGVVFNYFSQAVMVAIVTGVGIVIILRQVGNFLGVLMNMPEDIDFTVQQIVYSLELANGYAFWVGLSTVVAGVVIKKVKSSWPHHIVAIVVGTFVSLVLDFIWGASVTQIDRLGTMSLSVFPISYPDFSPGNFAEAAEGLIPASVLIAIMGMIQSTVIARSLASKSGESVDMNQEVAGQGLSNIAGSFFSCFPACGSFNRSAANDEAGAITPISGVISAMILVLIIYVAGPAIAYLPIPVMAGVLFLVGANLIKWKDIVFLCRLNRETGFIFVVTLCTTLYGGLHNGVFLGAFLSIAAYLRRTSYPEITRLKDAEALEQLARIPRAVTCQTPMVLRISGNVFFGSVERLENAFSTLAIKGGRKSTLIIVADYLLDIDESGVMALKAEINRRKDKNAGVFLMLRNKRVIDCLQRGGVFDLLGNDHVIITHYFEGNPLHDPE